MNDTPDMHDVELLLIMLSKEHWVFQERMLLPTG